MATNNRIIQHFKKKVDDFQATREEYKSKSKKLAFIRLLIAVIGLILIFALGQISILATSIALIVAVIAFILIVRRHDQVNDLLNETDILIGINNNEIRALINFENDYYDGQEFGDPNHYYTDDLDVFGSFSLFGLINRCRTFHGNRFLEDWFSKLDNINTIKSRNEAVKELEKDEEWRQILAASLYKLKDQEHINFADKIKHELAANMKFADKPGLRIYRKIIPLLWIGLVGLAFWDSMIASRLALVLGLLNITIAMKYMKPISLIQDRLSKSGYLLDQFMRSLYLIMTRKWDSSFLKTHIEIFQSNEEDASHPVKILGELKRIVDQLDYRLNIIAAFILNALVLWDLIIIDRLARWQEKHIHKIDEIFSLIGFFEAISSLSNWSANHPDYTYADLDDRHFMLSTDNISHPLIHEAQSIPNNFEVSEPGKINIITGSNMSGKSTFLRTIGTNIILAYAGTRVAADKLQCSVIQLMSYMRIKDALEENVSTFKAELNRVELMLKLVNENSKCLILIDEMLRGTNSKDKLKGSINITKKLIEQEAYAFIATHDIKLAELSSEYPDVIRNYYFDIDFENGDLKFDYKLKEGICENFNASFLLKKIGID